MLLSIVLFEMLRVPSQCCTTEKGNPKIEKLCRSMKMAIALAVGSLCRKQVKILENGMRRIEE